MAEEIADPGAVISGRFGRIWRSKPKGSSTGTVSTFAFRSGGSTGGRNTDLELTSVAFSPLGGTPSARWTPTEGFMSST